MNIFEMVEMFKTEQCHKEASILQLAAGETVRSKGLSRKRKEERMKRTNLMQETIPSFNILVL